MPKALGAQIGAGVFALKLPLNAPKTVAFVFVQETQETWWAVLGAGQDGNLAAWSPPGPAGTNCPQDMRWVSLGSASSFDPPTDNGQTYKKYVYAAPTVSNFPT